MQQLNCTIPLGLWSLMRKRSQEANEPVSQIVSSALADYFGVAHHTVYQVSTSTALVESIYQGAVRVGILRKHGDLGLGTFETSMTKWRSSTAVSSKSAATAPCGRWTIRS